MTKLRVVFAGSPQAAVPSLTAIAHSAHEVAAAVTRDDARIGRRRVSTPTPVALAADALGIPVIKANRLSGTPTEKIREREPDLGVVVAYGGLIREPLLSFPRLGWINLHFSVLPRWRGAAPVQRAIMAGDEITGASVFRLIDELDAGPILATMTQQIGRNETAGHLLESMSNSGAGLLVRVIDEMAEGRIREEAQSGIATHAPKLSIEDGRVNWSAKSAAVHQLIRGVTPEPGAFTMVNGERLKVLDSVVAHGEAVRSPGLIELDGGRVLVGTATEPMELVTVQPAGKKPMSAADWWRGRAGGKALAQ